MVILGIDPGYGRIGWGVIEGNKADWKHVAHGCIETSPKKSLAARLVEIEHELESIVETYKPEKVGIESLFFRKNVTTGLQVAHARGVMLLLFEKRNLKVAEIKPVEVKQAVTGQGNAEKRQVQLMVAMLLGLPKKQFQDDAADALAVALSCTHL